MAILRCRYAVVQPGRDVSSDDDHAMGDESEESFSTRFSSFRKNRVDEKRDLNSFLMGKYEDVDEEIYRATSSHFVGSDIRIITTRDVDL